MLNNNYFFLRILHDQTDRCLCEARGQIIKAETELANLESRMSTTHRETAVYEKEIAKLQGDIQVMKAQLSKIDKEKDDLLVNII
ncbi:hypothetical protein NQ314_005251 [Rhamnusium bicolor]|uniref:Uncharacterized protein n=1 Tax=Rhamnusium bicolor TaxID=1586634 RepID=A0AAV8ZKA0_9CUCU|nr:hypothetical protein NQ314_005251 [Rhamnusium bicolor]